MATPYEIALLLTILSTFLKRILTVHVYLYDYVAGFTSERQPLALIYNT